MTVIGIDVGTVRVGCATADPGVKIPFPVGVWPRAQGEAERNLLNLIADRQASMLIVGLPLGQNGERTTECEKVEAFVRRIAKRTPIKIVYVDEAFSSQEASEKLQQASLHRQRVDSFAACLILERYFETTS